MNTLMYTHPLTSLQLDVVTRTIGYKVVGPQAGKKLACGDQGPGAMTDWKDIVELVKKFQETPEAMPSHAVAGVDTRVD